MKPLKIVVTAALVNSKHQVLLTERPHGKPMAGFWEFPGGKIEAGEMPEQAIQRELFEEIGVNVDIKDLEPFTFVTADYEDFMMIMPLYLCFTWTGEVTSKENQKFEWVCPGDILKFPLPPADIPLAHQIIKMLNQRLG